MSEKLQDPKRTAIYLLVRALGSALAGVLVMAAILFIAAGRFDWPMAWAFIGIYAFVSVVTPFVVAPDLLPERLGRVKEGTKRWDPGLVRLNRLLSTAVAPLIAALDLRFGWGPELSPGLQFGALTLFALGWAVFIWAMAVNKYFSREVRIQRERGHTVATAGPYRLVRHPGYIGAIVFQAVTGLVLGSAWALIPSALAALVLVVRTLLEDRALQEELPGYREYAGRVRYRLLPGVW